MPLVELILTMRPRARRNCGKNVWVTRNTPVRFTSNCF